MQAKLGERNLYDRMRRPVFRKSATSATSRLNRLASSPVVTLAIAICAWTIPNVRLRTLLLCLILIVGATALWSIAEYAWRWWKYLCSIEDRLNAFRSQVLENAKIDDHPNATFVFEIVGIADNSGSVNLLVHYDSNSGLRVGSRLRTVYTLTGEVWGTVQVAKVENGIAFAEPVDRAKPQFWEDLEDRMHRDPSAPSGFRLEPAVTVPDKRRIIKRGRRKGGTSTNG